MVLEGPGGGPGGPGGGPGLPKCRNIPNVAVAWVPIVGFCILVLVVDSLGCSCGSWGLLGWLLHIKPILFDDFPGIGQDFIENI